MKVEELACKTPVILLFESLLNKKGTCTLTRLSTLATSGKEKSMAPLGQIRPGRRGRWDPMTEWEQVVGRPRAPVH